MDNTGERVKKLRKMLAMTQKSFAAVLGITQGHVANIESGTADPSEQLVKLVGKTFGVNEKWLSSGDGPIEIEVGPPLPEYDLDFELKRIKNKAVQYRLRSWLLRVSSVTSEIKDLCGDLKGATELRTLKDPLIIEHRKRLEASVVELLQTLGIFFDAPSSGRCNKKTKKN